MSQLPLFRETVASNVITKIRNDVRTGKSGEHLVLAKLTRWDYDAHDAPQDLAYDVIVDHHGRVLRVQVKTRSFASGSLWHNRVQRGNWRSRELRGWQPQTRETCQQVTWNRPIFFPCASLKA